MKILVQFPTRSRPNKFFQTLVRYQHTRQTDNVHFLITIDRDDHTMNNETVFKVLKQWGNLSYQIIEPSGKIGAINAGIDNYINDYDIILVASDDMIPIRDGWDATIINEMRSHYPDTDGVLWFNDGYQFNNLNTLCILGRAYYKRFGYIYHPSYKSLWCDNEFMDVANMLNKQTYFHTCIIKHEHPIHFNGKGFDQLNIRDNNFMDDDEKNYRNRKQNNFDIGSATTTTSDFVSIDTDINGSKTNVRPSGNGVKQTNKRGRPRKKSSNM